ncbi:MAG: ORF6N domain-containing protein [Nitrospira sp.]|nr:MAG: ORF6N domain-containing protein [Nitrospira sp.]
MRALVPRERIEQTILLIRGHRVMLDADLAKLYGVTTFNLNKAVKRNADRFPDDFMFRLSAQETTSLTFQIGISKFRGRGGRRSAPYVFTEQGVAMLSSVLRSKRAIQVNIAIMRAFVKLRELVTSHRGLASKLAQLERKVGGHDGQIRSLFDVIRQLVEPSASKSRRIGFKT